MTDPFVLDRFDDRDDRARANPQPLQKFINSLIIPLNQDNTYYVGRKRKQEWLASDAYFSWRTRVREAKKSIVLFSPYLDDLAVQLLKKAHLPAEGICVVTDLSPSNANILQQLKSLKKMLNLGFDVRSLDRLHAKVLYIDQESATVGSQNFTRYGRGSRETTVAPQSTLKESEFRNTLDQWVADSEAISLALVEYLIKNFASEIKELNKTQEVLSSVFEQLRSDVKETQRAEAEAQAALRSILEYENDGKAWFRKLANRSSVRMAGDRVFGSMQYAPNFYRTLKIDQGQTLVDWVKDVDGQSHRIKLPRLYYPPVILTDSLRMGFARVGKTQISYVFTSLIRDQKFQIGPIYVDITVSMPETGTTKNNLNLRFTSSWSTPKLECEIRTHFDGESLRTVRVLAESGEANENFAIACRNFLENEATRQEFLEKYFSSNFRYRGLGKPNAADFFTRSRYQLEVIEFANTPILIATPLY